MALFGKLTLNARPRRCLPPVRCFGQSVQPDLGRAALDHSIVVPSHARVNLGVKQSNESRSTWYHNWE
jgi:hypothetical protein